MGLGSDWARLGARGGLSLRDVAATALSRPQLLHRGVAFGGFTAIGMLAPRSMLESALAFIATDSGGFDQIFNIVPGGAAPAHDPAGHWV
jgi:hypothetical protein